MKLSLYLIALLLQCIVSNAQHADSVRYKDIYFDTLTFSGIIAHTKEGIWEKKVYFKNISKKPVIIRNVQTGGGPDICEWQKEPIMPGKTGSIKYMLNTIGRGPYPSHFYKFAYVRIGGREQDPITITFSGTIIDDASAR